MDDLERQRMLACGKSILEFGFTRYYQLIKHFGWTLTKAEEVIRLMMDHRLIVYDYEDNSFSLDLDMWHVWESYGYSKNFSAYYRSDALRKERMSRGIHPEAQDFRESFRTGGPVPDSEPEQDEEQEYHRGGRNMKLCRITSDAQFRALSSHDDMNGRKTFVWGRSDTTIARRPDLVLYCEIVSRFSADTLVVRILAPERLSDGYWIIQGGKMTEGIPED